MYTPLDSIFGIVFHLTADAKLNMLFGVMTMSILVSTIIMVITAKVQDQKELKKIKGKMSKLQEKLKAAQKKNDTKQANKISKEMMGMQSTMMTNTMKPMLYTFVPIIIIFGWLRQYPDLQNFIEVQGYLVTLPFALPYWGSKLGWLGWYILCSFPASSLIRKVLKMDIM
jgi:uncharacterized membrane protein (DUF106 family)